MHTKHIEHFEDCILTGDTSVLDFFKGTYEISLKLDGSPALVYGKNPVNGKCVISTKSAFNKVKIKLCHSHEEIDTHFEGKVADILHACFDYLPRTDSIIQSDFLGYGNSDTFQPNTISYKFPEVITQKIVLAPHTLWHTETELKDAVVVGSAPIFTDTDDVKFVQPCVDTIRPQMPDMDVSNVQFLTDSQAKEAKKQINQLLREGSNFEWWEITDILGCRNLSHLYLTMIEIKQDLMDSMIVSDSPKAYIGDQEIVGEGFVLKNSNTIFKLVDRFTFSRSNFLMPKNW